MLWNRPVSPRPAKGRNEARSCIPPFLYLAVVIPYNTPYETIKVEKSVCRIACEPFLTTTDLPFIAP